MLDGPAADVARPDATTLTCLEKWQQHVVMLGPEVPLTALNTNVMERDVFVTLDEKTLYFSRANPDPDVFVSTRTDTALPFGAPVMTELDTAADEGKISLTADGMLAALSTDFNTTTPDIELYTRTSSTSFTLDGPVAVAATAAGDYDPYITPDGLRLYWAPGGPNSTPQQIALASRPNVDTTFAFDHTLTELGTYVGDPAPSYDETVMLFTTQTDAGAIEYATRAAVTDPFTIVGLVPTINTPDTEGDAHLTRDACHVYFARYISAVTDWDLYVAPVL